MKAVFANYNYTPDWIKGYDLDYLIFDRSDSSEYLKDFPKERVITTKNIGNVDYDKLMFLVDFYDNLPEVFLWGKTNLFKYIEQEEFDKALKKPVFTPLLSKNHKTYSDKFGKVCFYQNNIYYERNDGWYLNEHLPHYVHSWQDWAQNFGLPNPQYIPFAPGGNYILTKERVHRYSVDFYADMRATLPHAQLPGEAQLCERSYYLLWQ